MQIRHTHSAKETAAMDTAALRQEYLIENLFVDDRIRLTYSHYDRMIVGGAVPVNAALELDNPDKLRAGHFLERRELGIINIGGRGTVHAGAESYALDKLDCLYLGRGTENVRFDSASAEQPARFYLLSTPAHRVCPNRRLTGAEASPAPLGVPETANVRTVYKYIYLDGIESCQLVMGLTVLETGSVWNTLPPHTHDRRMEVYCYFDVADGQRVLHLMGQPEETRHLWVANGQAVISPPWSVHAGCGTAAYAFIWGMAGENQVYNDMDPVAIADLL
jgi:4-deoxy-L-threo-5-hexosulose-uronate ketol-isomerase